MDLVGASMGIEHEDVYKRLKMLADADAVFVGGGNTFRLLKALYETGLLEPIRARAEDGMPYIGTSAGSNVACASIRTTNGRMSFTISPNSGACSRRYAELSALPRS